MPKKYIWSPWRMKYIMAHEKSSDCIFCVALQSGNDEENLIVYRGERAFVILNRYPYTSGHLMVVPYAHHGTLNKLDEETRHELIDLSTRAECVLQAVYEPEGFNVGVNIGTAAGAGVAGHIHIHIVPRWFGDTNFMSSVADARVLPETLEDTYRRVKEAWSNPGE